MLNRRGFSHFCNVQSLRSCYQMQILRFTTCLSSSWYLTMPSLRYHRNRSYYLPQKCNSKYIKFFGSGTEKLEEELSTLFPQARIIRLDRDTTGKKFAHLDILKQFKAGLYDIFIRYANGC